MWERRRRTGVERDLPGCGKEEFIHACTVVRVGEVLARIITAGEIAMSTFNVFALSQAGIGLWKGCAGGHGVGGGVNLSIKYVFRNQDKAHSLEALF